MKLFEELFLFFVVESFFATFVYTRRNPVSFVFLFHWCAWRFYLAGCVFLGAFE